MASKPMRLASSFLACLLIGGTLSLVGAPAAGATPVTVVEHSPTPQFGFFHTNDAGPVRLAQTFTLPADDTAAHITLRAGTSGSLPGDGTARLRLLEGGPTSTTVLADSFMDVPPAVYGGTDITFPLGTVPLTANQQYTILVSSDAPIFWGYGCPAGGYPAGAMFLGLTTGSWTEMSCDLRFKVTKRYVPPAPTSWDNLVTPPQPDEVRLRTIGFAAEQSGWSWAAAAQTLIKYHMDVRPDQCELVKDGRQASSCAAGSGSFSDILAALHEAGMTGMGYSNTETISFADVVEDIDATRPIIAELEDFTLDSVNQGTVHALINGYDKDGDKVHFVLFPASSSDPAWYSQDGSAMPIDDFEDRSSPFTFTYDGSAHNATWTWSGTMIHAEGDPAPEPESEETHTAESVARAINEDTGALFMLTVEALKQWEVPFPCPTIDLAAVDEDLHDALEDFWSLRAMTDVVKYLDLHVQIGRVTAVEDIAAKAIEQLDTGIGLIAGDVPPIGFAGAVLHSLWALAYFQGTCSY